jgi:hypothetical protein
MAITNQAVSLDAYLPRTPLIGASEMARLLGFPSTGALAKARQTGRLPIPMFQLPGRRGWFASTAAVKAFLEAMVASGTPVHAPRARGVQSSADEPLARGT